MPRRRDIGIIEHGVALGRAAIRHGWILPWPTSRSCGCAQRHSSVPVTLTRAAPGPHVPARCRSRPPSPHDRSQDRLTIVSTCRAPRSRGQQARCLRSSSPARTTATIAMPMSSSRIDACGISPSATATPSALAARDRPMDLSVSCVAVFCPRAAAPCTFCAVSSGHLTCTKCTSAGSPICASFIAATTPLATASTWPARPRCSGGKAGVWARPTASAGVAPALAFKALEDRPMRRHAAFGAARHHEADLLGLFLRHVSHEELTERQRRVTAGEIVDAAVTLGLAENGNDRRRIDRSCLDRPLRSR